MTMFRIGTGAPRPGATRQRCSVHALSLLCPSAHISPCVAPGQSSMICLPVCTTYRRLDRGIFTKRLRTGRKKKLLEPQRKRVAKSVLQVPALLHMKHKSRCCGVLLLVCLPAMCSAFVPALPSGQARAAGPATYLSFC